MTGLNIYRPPTPDYLSDGGFVGRSEYIEEIKKELIKGRAPIVTISGPGGVGKTAIALEICERLSAEPLNNPFKGIFWFSAKKTCLSEHGIQLITPDFVDSDSLITDILHQVEQASSEDLHSETEKKYTKIQKINFHLEKNTFLVVIDNLETVYQNSEIIEFIKNIPAPSKVLITTRLSLGEVEKRFDIKPMNNEEACNLFKTVALARNMKDFLYLSDEEITKKYVKKAYNIPLLIKWMIGKFCLGEKFEKFSPEIDRGDGDVARFIFDDLYLLLSDDAKKILFCINYIGGNIPVRERTIQYFSNIHGDKLINEIENLVRAALIFESTVKKESGRSYSILDLTQDFINEKSSRNTEIKHEVEERYRNVRNRISKLPKQLHFYFSTKIVDNPEDVDVFELVEKAKEYINKNDFDNAEICFNDALVINPKNIELLIQYSSFLHKVRNPQAIGYAKRAIMYGEDNAHALYNYGVILSDSENTKYEALEALKKAKNKISFKDHLIPKIINKIAEIYTQLNQYQSAIDEITKFLENHVNEMNKNALISLYKLMMNIYYTWGMEISDLKGKKEKLKLSLENAKKALTLRDLEFDVYNLSRDIFFEYGKIICDTDGLEQGQFFFNKCMEVLEIKDNKSSPFPEQIYKVNYWRIFYSIKEGKPYGFYEHWFDEGLKNATDNEKRMKLHELVSLNGFIFRYNPDFKKGYIVDSNKKNFVAFHISSFIYVNGRKRYLENDEMIQAVNKKVLYQLEESPNYGLQARNIIVLK